MGCMHMPCRLRRAQVPTSQGEKSVKIMAASSGGAIPDHHPDGQVINRWGRVARPPPELLYDPFRQLAVADAPGRSSPQALEARPSSSSGGGAGRPGSSSSGGGGGARPAPSSSRAGPAYGEASSSGRAGAGIGAGQGGSSSRGPPAGGASGLSVRGTATTAQQLVGSRGQSSRAQGQGQGQGQEAPQKLSSGFRPVYD